jgi:hypothetical protein
VRNNVKRYLNDQQKVTLALVANSGNIFIEYIKAVGTVLVLK